MNKLSQFRKVIILSLILASSCGFKKNSFENYQSSINETLNPNNSNLKEIKNIHDVRDMSGCGMDIELGKWYKNKILSKALNREMWSRPVSEYDHGIIGSGEYTLDFRPEDSTPNLLKNPNAHIVYIGPWQYYKKIGKEIRFAAYTGRRGGDIRSQFESKNSENQNIKNKPFSFPNNAAANPPRSSLCIVKWIANHGYDSISKVKSKNPFSKNYMVPTGEIIEIDE